MRPWAEQRAAILHWLVVCGACRRLTLVRALTPCAPIVRFSSNEVVKYSFYSNVRQYLAAQFFLGPFSAPVPPTSPFFVRPSSRPEGRSHYCESVMFCPPDGPAYRTWIRKANPPHPPAHPRHAQAIFKSVNDRNRIYCPSPPGQTLGGRLPLIPVRVSSTKLTDIGSLQNTD